MTEKTRPDHFRHLLANLRFGGTEHELNEALAEALRAAADTGKAAEITLKIKIVPKARSGQFVIQDKVTTKLPQLPAEDTIMFEGEGGLQREDPRQHKLPLRDAGASTGLAPVRDIEAAPGSFREAK